MSPLSNQWFNLGLLVGAVEVFFPPRCLLFVPFDPLINGCCVFLHFGSKDQSNPTESNSLDPVGRRGRGEAVYGGGADAHRGQALQGADGRAHARGGAAQTERPEHGGEKG